jgi:hypothetical protein
MVELLSKCLLVEARRDPGTPELVGDEQQDKDSEGEDHSTEPGKKPPPGHNAS